MQLIFRWIEEDDVRFVANSWLKSYREDGFAGGIPNSEYYENHRRLIQRVFDQGSILMVADAESTDKIIGWAAYEDTDDGRVVHYIYVKRGVRNAGFGRAIMAKLADDRTGSYSHRTFSGKKLCKGLRRSGWVYNPYKFLCT